MKISFPAFNVYLISFRTAIVGVMLLICSANQNFGAILDLIGGSAVTLLTFVFPPLLYLLLASDSFLCCPAERHYCFFVIFLGLFGGAVASGFAVFDMVNFNGTNLSCCLCS